MLEVLLFVAILVIGVQSLIIALLVGLVNKTRQEKNAHYFKRKNMNDMSLDRTHSNIAYKESLNSLNNLLYYAEKIGCDDCGEHEFAIAEGNVYCRNCGLVFE